MKAGTFTRPGPLPRTAEPSEVTAYFHRSTGLAWLDVSGDITSPARLSGLLSQLRRAHRRLPPGVKMVGVDLSRLGEEVTVDLAVLLCLESRMLSVRDIKLAVVLREETETPPGVRPLLERLRIWRVNPDQLDLISLGSAHARLGRDGWEPLEERNSGAVPTRC